MKWYHITSLLKTIAQLSTAFGKSSVSWSARFWLLCTGLASQPSLLHSPLTEHSSYTGPLHTLSLCVGRQGLYGSLKILQVLEADALPAYVLDSLAKAVSTVNSLRRQRSCRVSPGA